MNLNSICKKLVKENIENYKILIFCLIVGITLFTSYGLLIFSPTITDVIMNGGSTQIIAYSIYIVFAIACLIFIIYSHSLFMKYKSHEIGVFLSLGINKSSIKNILLKEFKYILPISAFIGIIIALPFTYLIWGLIRMVAGGLDVKYKIGWIGFIGGVLFSFISILLINKKTSKYIKKLDIIKILKTNDAIENVKSSNYNLGILGLIMIPIGVFCADMNIRGLFLPSISFAKFIFFLMVIIGLYLLCSSLTSIGTLVKKINNKTYYENIIFFNLLKLRGRQYTSTLFTVTTLIAVTIFTMCFSFVNILAKNNIAEIQNPFDYSVVKSLDQNKFINKDTIFEVANKNNTNITTYHELEILTIVREADYGTGNEYIEEIVMSEDDYNNIYKENIDVKPGKYNMVCEEKGILKLESYNNMEISLMGSDSKYDLEKQDSMPQRLLPNQIGNLNFVLDKNDYKKFKSNSDNNATRSVLLFNVDDWKKSYTFAKNLEKEILEKNDNGIKMYGDFFSQKYYAAVPEFKEIDEISSIDYRDWAYRLNSKILQTTDGLKIDMVYPLLFGYISLLAFISSAMVLYIKVLNTSWQDNDVYKNISLIGADSSTIKSIITKQLMVIFLLPVSVGSILGILIEMAMTNQNLTASIYKNYAIIFAVCFCILQFIVFILARKAVLKKASYKLKEA